MLNSSVTLPFVVQILIIPWNSKINIWFYFRLLKKSHYIYYQTGQFILWTNKWTPSNLELKLSLYTVLILCQFKRCVLCTTMECAFIKLRTIIWTPDPLLVSMTCQNEINSTSQNIMQLSKYHSTWFKISGNFQSMVQLLEIYHATQDQCIFMGTCIIDLRKGMGVVPERALLVGKVAGKGEIITILPFHMWWRCR